MQFASSLRILGILLVIFSLLHIPPMLVSLWYADNEFTTFGQAFCLTMATGATLWLLFYNQRRDLRAKDGFFIVTLLWLGLSSFGALPFVLSTQIHIDWIDSFFESVSGFTTTGATVLVGLDDYPKSLLYYRAQLQLLGGMGIIILAVAILPLLGIGGLQLFRAEVTGPVKDNKLTPRIKETAKALWLVYMGLTIACILSYWWAGMSLFDSICYGFSTISTGGFGTHDNNFGFYSEPRFLLIVSFFMLLGAINFALHFVAFRNLTARPYWHDPETRGFLLFMVSMIAFCWGSLCYFQADYSVIENFLRSMFMVVSIVTTAGFTIENITFWPTYLAVTLLFVGLIGGCSGSTTGGMKMIRAITLRHQIGREIKKSIHPNGRFPLKIQNMVIPDKVADAVWGFLGVYMITVVVVFLLLLTTNLDIASALSGAISSVANLGPALNMLGDNFGQANDTAKLIICFAMLVGRLEIFTVLVLFTPAFWRS